MDSLEILDDGLGAFPLMITEHELQGSRLIDRKKRTDQNREKRFQQPGNLDSGKREFGDKEDKRQNIRRKNDNKDILLTTYRTIIR